MSELVLMANIGAEEHAGAPPLARARPAVRHLARLWQSVMPVESRFLSENTEGLTASHPDLGAWPWLPQSPGLLPWLSTPGARKRASDLNLPLLSPRPDVTDVVHDKGFALARALEHGHTPECLRKVIHTLESTTSPDDAERTIRNVLESWPEWARANFTIKPRRGTSGRGRIAGYDGHITPEMARGLHNLNRQGGAIIEPWLTRKRDLSVQLYVSPEGSVEVLATTTQLLSKSGVYHGNLGSFEEGELRSATEYDTQLIEAGRALARAAASQGFFGPCGIDAFVFEHPSDGSPTLRPVVEFNARYTTATAGLAHLKGRFAQHQLPAHGGWLFVLNASDELVELARSTPQTHMHPWYSPNEGLCALLVWAEGIDPIEDLAHRAKLLGDSA